MAPIRIVFALAGVLFCLSAYWGLSQRSPSQKVSTLTSLLSRAVGEKIYTDEELLRMGYLPAYLVQAAVGGKVQVIQEALNRGIDINAHDYSIGMTMLHHAAKSRRLETVKFLVEHGADPNSLDEDHSTPLHFAAYTPHNRAVIEFLLGQPGVDPSRKDDEGYSAAQYAALVGETDVVVLLENAKRTPASPVKVKR